MELLYFICGILTVGVVYGTVLLFKVKSSYHDALARLQHHQNISSIRNGDLNEKLGDMERLVLDIQSNMEKDQYENLSNINSRVDEIEQAVKVNIERLRTADDVFRDIKGETQNLKLSVKKLGEDPNFVSRY